MTLINQQDKSLNKKFKIGLFASMVGDSIIINKKVDELVSALVELNPIILSGLDKGLHYDIACMLAKKGLEIWGFAPSIDVNKQKELTPEADFLMYKKIFYIPAEFPFVQDEGVNQRWRSTMFAAYCDAAIIVSGAWGTINEFTCVQRMKKPVGILTGTGGFADELQRLGTIMPFKRSGPIVFNNDPKLLIKELITLI